MSIYLHYYLDIKRKQDRSGKLPSLNEVKNNYVNYLLDVTDHNLEETAEILNVPPTSLKKKIKTVIARPNAPKQPPVIASETKQSPRHCERSEAIT
jgi:hypothetical protein